MADRDPLLDPEVRIYVEGLLEAAALEDAFAVVLTGSVARRATPCLWSDVDIVALELSSPDAPPAVHLMEMKVPEFEEKVRGGDDVAQWAARHGRPLYGHARWDALVRRVLCDAPWPDYREKLAQSNRRLEVSRALLDAGDARSAQKELVYAASHLGRALLFANRVFPLSRPELPDQLRDVDEYPTARVLEALTASLLESVKNLDDIWGLVSRRAHELERTGIGV